MKNQIFDASRFSAYFKKYVVEKKNSLLISFSAILLFSIALCVGWPYIKGYYSPEAVKNFVVHANILDPMWYSELKFFILMWVIACVMGCETFSTLTKKKDRIALFTCPASNFEKFATYFLIYIIIFPVLTFLCFLFADAIRVWVYSATTDGASCIHYISPHYLLSFGCDMKYINTDLYLYNSAITPDERAELIKFLETSAAVQFSLTLFGGLLMQALFALGSAVWPKKSGLKTLSFFWGFGIVASILFYQGIRLFWGNAPIEPRSFGIQSEMTQIVIYDAIALCVIVFTWVVSYYRFKEWEVINRW